MPFRFWSSMAVLLSTPRQLEFDLSWAEKLFAARLAAKHCASNKSPPRFNHEKMASNASWHFISTDLSWRFCGHLVRFPWNLSTVSTADVSWSVCRIFAMCSQILHRCLRFAVQESADYLYSSSAGKCELLVTCTVALLMHTDSVGTIFVLA